MTSGPRKWMRKPCVSSESCKVKDLLITKCKSCCTRQKSLSKERLHDFCKLAKGTVTITANVTAMNESSETYTYKQMGCS